ncbi:MAG: hypothetical protein HOK24_23355 [Desulfobacula sp.]|jgi:hypothetical protein|nr:hypothetical protein [Desulfobacula sp.]
MQTMEAQNKGLKFVSSRPVDGALLLYGLWKRLGIDSCLAQALKDREFKAPVIDTVIGFSVVYKALDKPAL